MRTKVEVTQFDIDLGIPGACWRCPVALALQRTLRSALRIQVLPECISIQDEATYQIYYINTPLEVERFIHVFDGHKPPWKAKPQTFEFDIHDELLRETP